MKTLFKRHRVRATFYHIIAALYLITMVLAELDWLGIKTAFWIGVILFVADYVAEMYDPNPDSPGTWFKRHFHRFCDDSNEDDE